MKVILYESGIKSPCRNCKSLFKKRRQIVCQRTCKILIEFQLYLGGVGTGISAVDCDGDDYNIFLFD